MSRYRAGPWPGLTPAGARVLLACAVFLAIGQLLVGTPNSPLPDLPVIGLTALLPLLIATRIIAAPGAATAVCGAYLLPASLVALLQPAIQPPPLLLVPAVAFDLALWVNLSQVASLWPRRQSPRRRRDTPVQPTTLRSAMAGAAFGLILTAVEPPFRVFLGGDPSVWFGPARWLAAVASAIVCGGLGTLLTFRGRAT